MSEHVRILTLRTKGDDVALLQYGLLELSAIGIAVGNAAIVSLFAMPLRSWRSPLLLCRVATCGKAIPTAEWLLRWRNGKTSVQEKGLC